MIHTSIAEIGSKKRDIIPDITYIVYQLDLSVPIYASSALL